MNERGELGSLAHSLSSVVAGPLVEVADLGLATGLELHRLAGRERDLAGSLMEVFSQINSAYTS